MAVDGGDSGTNGGNYIYISRDTKLMILQVRVVMLNYILVFAAMSLAPPTLDTDLMAPAGPPF